MIKNCLIVGGGVGGMSAALALAKRNVAVELVDVDPQWRAYGAGISVTGTSLRAFDHLGILEEVRERGFVGGGVRLRNLDGSVLMESLPPPDDAPLVDASGGIMRPVLHDIMQRHVRAAGVKVVLGVEPVAYDQTDQSATVTFSDGRCASYELVVAADGIFSKSRGMLFADAPKTKLTGQGCWRIVADRPAEVDRLEIYVGGKIKLGLNPVSASKLYAFILEHVPDNPWYEEAEMLPHVAQLLEPFGGPIENIRAGLGAESMVNYRPLEWLLMPQPWHKGRVVLIGDAIHATTPHMASGAGMAAEDGLVLGEELERTEDVGKALDAFGARRLERARMVVENSVRIGEIEMAGGNQIDANRMLGDTTQKLKLPY